MNQRQPSITHRTLKLESLEDRRLLSVQRLGEISSRRPSYTQSEDALYFRSEDAEHGAEVWRSTASGIELFADLLPGPESSDAANLHWIGNSVFAIGQNASGATVQYVSDGTPTGTQEVGFTNRGFTSGVFQENLITVLIESNGNNVLVKIGVDGSIEQLTTLGSERTVGRLIATDNYLHFHVSTADRDIADVWRTDGTADGTEVIFERTNAPRYQYSLGGSYVYLHHTSLVGVPEEGSTWWMGDVQQQGSDTVERAEMDDHLYFVAYRESTGYELWRTDGTEAGTGVFLDSLPGAESSYPHSLTVSGDRLFFQARDESLSVVQWSTDGTAEGTVRQEVSLPTIWSNRVLAGDRVLSSTSDGYWLAEADGTRRKLEWNPWWYVVGSTNDRIFFITREDDDALYAYEVGDFATADVDRNGPVDFQDFLTLSANFGRDGVGRPEGDLDDDGKVTMDDFAILAAQFGCLRS